MSLPDELIAQLGEQTKLYLLFYVDDHGCLKLDGYKQFTSRSKGDVEVQGMTKLMEKTLECIGGVLEQELENTILEKLGVEDELIEEGTIIFEGYEDDEGDGDIPASNVDE